MTRVSEYQAGLGQLFALKDKQTNYCECESNCMIQQTENVPINERTENA